jgi:hypothetical protein
LAENEGNPLYHQFLAIQENAAAQLDLAEQLYNSSLDLLKWDELNDEQRANIKNWHQGLQQAAIAVRNPKAIAVRNPNGRSPWEPTREAADFLGVSDSTLFRYRKEEILVSGKHWRRKWPAFNSPVLYHLENCEKALMDQYARDHKNLELAGS